MRTVNSVNKPSASRSASSNCARVSSAAPSPGATISCPARISLMRPGSRAPTTTLAMALRRRRRRAQHALFERARPVDRPDLPAALAVILLRPLAARDLEAEVEVLLLGALPRAIAQPRLGLRLREQQLDLPVAAPLVAEQLPLPLPGRAM